MLWWVSRRAFYSVALLICSAQDKILCHAGHGNVAVISPVPPFLDVEGARMHTQSCNQLMRTHSCVEPHKSLANSAVNSRLWSAQDWSIERWWPKGAAHAELKLQSSNLTFLCLEQNSIRILAMTHFELPLSNHLKASYTTWLRGPTRGFSPHIPETPKSMYCIYPERWTTSQITLLLKQHNI